MAAPTWDVIGIGENSIDYVYRLPTHPAPHGADAKLPILDSSVTFGGQVATTLCTCAALGLSTAYLGAFGSDDAGTRLRSELAARGVDVSTARTRDATNRYAVILVDARTGERIVLWHRDARLALTDDDIGADTIGAARLVHVDAVDERMAIRAARLAREAGVPVTTDIDTVTAHTPDLVAAATVPIFAEGIAATLTGAASDEDGLRRLRARHDGLLCVTRGARGSMLLDGDELILEAAFAVDVVDATGAGDVFRGAFIRALLRGETPRQMLRFANAAAALACTRPGAIGGVPSLADVDALLATRA